MQNETRNYYFTGGLWRGLSRLGHSENDDGDGSEQNSSASDPQTSSSQVW